MLARPVVRHGLRARVQRLCSFAVGEDDGRVAHEVSFSCFAADEGDGQAVLIGCLFEVEFELLAAGGDVDVLDDQGPVAVAGDPGAVDLVVAHRYFMVGCLVRVGRAVRAARGAVEPDGLVQGERREVDVQDLLVRDAVLLDEERQASFLLRFDAVECLRRVLGDEGELVRLVVHAGPLDWLSVVPRGDARPFWRADRAHDGVREKIFR